jgi:hypothetical protein
MCSPSGREKTVDGDGPHCQLSEITVSDATTFEGLSQFVATI